jgi:hypothetical protein
MGWCFVDSSLSSSSLSFDLTVFSVDTRFISVRQSRSGGKNAFVYSVSFTSGHVALNRNNSFKFGFWFWSGGRRTLRKALNFAWYFGCWIAIEKFDDWKGGIWLSLVQH